VTIAGSILLIAVGAILRFATHFHVQGVDLHTVGVILMIVGVIALLLSIWQYAVWSRRSRESEVVVDDRRERPPPRY
jgi:hypothetical protein